jgi:hypothetical protein
MRVNNSKESSIEQYADDNPDTVIIRRPTPAWTLGNPKSQLLDVISRELFLSIFGIYRKESRTSRNNKTQPAFRS